MKINKFAATYASGNLTGVVFDQLQKKERSSLNRDIILSWKAYFPDQPQIEQCCFVTKPVDSMAIGRIEMFGGEFCANATRGVLWLLAEGRDSKGLVEVANIKQLLSYEISSGRVSLEMPISFKSKLAESIPEGFLVRLDGIVQLVVPSENNKQSARQLLTRILKDDTYNLKKQPAVGVCIYDEKSKKAKFCVWVKKVNTIFDETACGSGTCAIGVAHRQSLDIVQPSGNKIAVDVLLNDATNQVESTYISGGVDVLYEGSLDLIRGSV